MPENGLANLLATAILAQGRKFLNAHFALVNGGGIRSDLPKGKLTYGDVFKVAPFDNLVVVVELTGVELKALLNIAYDNNHAMPGVAGLKIHKTEKALDILDAETGKPLKDTTMYRLATLDFLADGGDDQGVVYNKIPASRKHIIDDSRFARDMLADFIKAQKTISPEEYYREK
jgi:2',3'-cyclic-nucleotide 2'-phosphodiesterase (5'-nucleotidase family)